MLSFCLFRLRIANRDSAQNCASVLMKKENEIKRKRQWSLTPLIPQWSLTPLIPLILGMSMCADAGIFGFGSKSWKEEVLLHDGSKIIAKRSQSYGGRHEVGQSSPIKEQVITFSVPNANKTLTFKSEYGEDIGRANFNLLALHILNGVPYLVVEPNLCLSYNKWGRPNPPYVFFKHGGKAWQRIPLSEFPPEFKEINLVVNSKGEERIIAGQSIVTAELIKKLNGELTQPAFRSILREAVKGGGGMSGCMEEIRTGDGWMSLDWFSSQKTYEACLKLCEREKVAAQNCPCNKLFKGKNRDNTN